MGFLDAVGAICDAIGTAGQAFSDAYDDYSGMSARELRYHRRLLNVQMDYLDLAPDDTVARSMALDAVMEEAGLK